MAIIQRRRFDSDVVYTNVRNVEYITGDGAGISIQKVKDKYVKKTDSHHLLLTLRWYIFVL